MLVEDEDISWNPGQSPPREEQQQCRVWEKIYMFDFLIIALDFLLDMSGNSTPNHEAPDKDETGAFHYEVRMI